MKKYLLHASALLFILTLGLPALHAQTTDDGGIAEEDRTAALVYEFNYDFDVVFEGIKKGLENAGYEVGYASKRKSVVESEFKMLTDEDSDFFEVMEQYGKIPYIRSPRWRSGRVLVTTRLEKNEETGLVTITLTAEMSAFEERFQNNWIYWNSNGILEEQALEAIVQAVDETAQGSDL